MGLSDPSQGRLGDRTPSQNMQLQIASATWRIEKKSDYAICQITSVFVSVVAITRQVAAFSAFYSLRLTSLLRLYDSTQRDSI